MVGYSDGGLLGPLPVAVSCLVTRHIVAIRRLPVRGADVSAKVHRCGSNGALAGSGNSGALPCSEVLADRWDNNSGESGRGSTAAHPTTGGWIR